MSHSKVHITCPNCGSLLRIEGVLEKVRAPDSKTTDEILTCFIPSVRPFLNVEIEGNFARITLKGKFNKKRFGKVMSEVRGYGGRWIKGHFMLPLAGLGET